MADAAADASSAADAPADSVDGTASPPRYCSGPCHSGDTCAEEASCGGSEYECVNGTWFFVKSVRCSGLIATVGAECTLPPPGCLCPDACGRLLECELDGDGGARFRVYECRDAGTGPSCFNPQCDPVDAGNDGLDGATLADVVDAGSE